MTHEHGKIRVEERFYRNLGFDDEKVLSNVELGIELYIGKHDKEGQVDAGVNFERALGAFSTSYVRIAQDIFRKRETDPTPEQKLFLNFGVVDPRLVQSEKVIDELAGEIDAKRQPDRFEIYYLSEWMEKIAYGRINLTTEMAQVKSKTKTQENESKLKEKRLKLEEELEKFFKDEFQLSTELKLLFKLFMPDVAQGEKLKVISNIRKRVADLERIIKEENVRFIEIEGIKTREGKSDGDGIGGILSEKYSKIREEFDIIVTVMRSCAARGRLIKNTPVLIDKWIPLDTRLSLNTYEYVESKLKELEEIDYTIFTTRGARNAPKILILPGVGTGMAWKDRIMIPLFPPPNVTPEISMARTLASFRWYLATSSYNWKHLTDELGGMYQLIYPELTFTNLEKSFVEDYTNWITKELQGYQVLPANVRNLFWKKIPFSKHNKEILAKRAAIYRKLFSEEIARHHH